jgi:hypothetical protein
MRKVAHMTQRLVNDDIKLLDPLKDTKIFYQVVLEMCGSTSYDKCGYKFSSSKPQFPGLIITGDL